MKKFLERLQDDAVDLWCRGTAGKLTLVCIVCAAIGIAFRDPVPNMAGDSITIGVFTALFAYRHDIGDGLAHLVGGRR